MKMSSLKGQLNIIKLAVFLKFTSLVQPNNDSKKILQNDSKVLLKE